MTIAQYPNRDALQKGLGIFRDNMSMFITRQLRQERGSTLVETVLRSLTEYQRPQFEANMGKNQNSVETSIEVGFIPRLVEQNWRDAFQQPFIGYRTIRNTLRMIRDVRNDMHHNAEDRDIEGDLAETGLYHISEALRSINCPEEQRAVLDIRENIRQGSIQTAASQPELISIPTQETRSGSSLKAWREVMTPNPDVEDGSFEEAEFAANLQDVHDGSAPAVYGDPLEFFRRTYITNGIENLLVTAVSRINGKGGNPVIQTKTGFGGGKTHSLIALYHLINSDDDLLNAPNSSQYSRVRDDIRRILDKADVEPNVGIQARVAVISGTWLSPTSDRKTDSGDPLNTLWGEMAWQLGGQEAYEIIGAAARTGNAPGGEELESLFGYVGPCVILMDEIVNYARNADMDRISTFFQNLTEAVQSCTNVLLVVSLPVSTTEAGGERGMHILSVFGSLLNRIQSVMQVTETRNDEAFNVVRRRLFQDEFNEEEKEKTCRAFHRMYQNRPGGYPDSARETRYLERLRQCYPIHPEVFDRLYQDWSLYHDFQRTRGVLRLMAQTISWLCADGDDAPMIMPANLPFSDPEVSNEFVRLLGPQWEAVISEVDQENSRTHAIDLQHSGTYGAVGGAARRIARAVFLGSSTQTAARGIDDKQVNLSVVMPSHGVSTYRDALNDMDGKLYYFYKGNDNRYYFDAQENLNKVANDRAAEFSTELLDTEIIRRLSEFRSNNQNRAVIVCPQGIADVPDTDHVRLIILSPSQTRPSRSAEQDRASEAAGHILTTYGNDARRNRANTLVFLAATADPIRDLRNVTRRFLAWDSINNSDRRMQLTGERRTQVRTQQAEADRALQRELENAYRWIMAPTQPDPLNTEYDISKWTQVAADADIASNAFKGFAPDERLVDTLTPDGLNGRLQEYLWNAPEPRHHITVDELWDMLTSRVYMRLRLLNRQVLEECLHRGIASGTFGRADSYDPNNSKEPYGNLLPPVSERNVAHYIPPLTGSTLIVESDAATIAWLDRADVPSSRPDTDLPREPVDHIDDDALEPTPAEQTPRQFIARKLIENNFAMYDFNQIREEIARTIAAAGGDVRVEIVVTGTKDDGFAENLVRSLRANSEMLGIDLKDDLTD